MTNTIKSERNGIYIKESETSKEVWQIKTDKHLLKFWKWIQKKKILPGDIIPIRKIKKYYKRSEKRLTEEKKKLLFDIYDVIIILIIGISIGMLIMFITMLLNS